MTDRRKIYVAGPISGMDNFNMVAFADATTMLFKEGWEVFNPLESKASRAITEDNSTHPDRYRRCLAEDMKYITEKADAMFMLQHWELSPGARAEHATGAALGLDFFYEV